MFGDFGSSQDVLLLVEGLLVSFLDRFLDLLETLNSGLELNALRLLLLDLELLHVFLEVFDLGLDLLDVGSLLLEGLFKRLDHGPHGGLLFDGLVNLLDGDLDVLLLVAVVVDAATALARCSLHSLELLFCFVSFLGGFSGFLDDQTGVLLGLLLALDSLFDELVGSFSESLGLSNGFLGLGLVHLLLLQDFGLINLLVSLLSFALGRAGALIGGRHFGFDFIGGFLDLDFLLLDYGCGVCVELVFYSFFFIVVFEWNFLNYSFSL